MGKCNDDVIGNNGNATQFCLVASYKIYYLAWHHNWHAMPG